MARHNPAEIATGAGVLLVAAGFVAFALVHTAQSGASGGYKLHASFDHVDGVSPGADVRIAGVKIGSVEAVKLDPKTFQANVTFLVKDGIDLTTDTSATISTEGLLGGKYVALVSGGDEKFLKPGDTITITQGSVNLEALLGKYIFGSTGGSKSGGSGGSGLK